MAGVACNREGAYMDCWLPGLVDNYWLVDVLDHNIPLRLHIATSSNSKHPRTYKQR